MVLCGTKNGSSTASWRTFWSTFIFKSVPYPVVFKPVLQAPLPCTFCMSPLSDTPNSTHQLVRLQDLNWVCLLRETYKMCRAGVLAGQPTAHSLSETSENIASLKYSFMNSFMYVLPSSGIIFHVCNCHVICSKNVRMANCISVNVNILYKLPKICTFSGIS